MSSDFTDPAARESALLPSQQQTLTEANYLLDNGKPAQAAPLFAKLAEVLASASQPKRAANLHAQAAMAFAKSRNEAPALMQARAALNLYLEYKIVPQAPFFYANIVRELTKRGMTNAAETLEKEFASKVGPQPTPVTPATGRLPTNCPHCGAPVRSNEVHWIDAHTAECAFCGTPIQSQA